MPNSTEEKYKIIGGEDYNEVEHKNISFCYRDDRPEIDAEKIKSQNESDTADRKSLFYEDYFDIIKKQFPDNPSPRNLGLYVRKGDMNLRSCSYVGVMPLKKKEGRDVINDIIIKIKPRFGANAVQMLRYIMKSEDFYEISNRIKFDSKSLKKWETEKYNDILYGVVCDLPSIELSNQEQDKKNNDLEFVELCGLFEIMEFIQYTKNVCRKMLKQQSGRVEENLTGKIKGRINISKQIKYNVSRGREDRIYCDYNKISVDTKENRILKYALHLVECRLRDYPDLMVDDLAYCKRALAPVKLVKCTIADFRGLKNNGVFCYYNNALNSAKKIISRISISYSGSEEKVEVSNKIQPFFVRMDLLFELYCRALVSDAINDINNDKNLRIRKNLRLRSYQEKLVVFKSNSGGTNIPIPYGFAEVKIPDIVIEEITEDQKTAKALMVLDAKYSDVDNEYSNRDRTFQILSYMFLLNCKYGGFIFPQPKKDNEDEKDKNDDKSEPKQVNIENFDKEKYGYSVCVKTSLENEKDYATCVEKLKDDLMNCFKEKEEENK